MKQLGKRWEYFFILALLPDLSLLLSDPSNCDRSGGRQGGGVALYVRDDLAGDILSVYVNSVCELLIVKIHQIDTVVCVAYRPPDTRLGEFAGLLKCLDEMLSALPSPSPNIILMGDFNFPHFIMDSDKEDIDT